ncbi:immunity protein 8 of polymorphic toxin system [Nocardia ignorata]|uniref:Immunity protein 8 of polymorphic toxin system n=1 Tax=Nocardia ignorata TaxID=145285 RepID=A0A4R6P7H2_NOCIG|nr:immunity protein 8 of polymorphic toxin system [Nocardia ignorata]
MKAELRAIGSPDTDIQTGILKDRDAIAIRFLAGPKGMAGEESFDLLVCTPRWIADQVGLTGLLHGRHKIIVDRIDLDAVSQYLRGYVAGLDEPTWPELAAKLGRIGMWEFEDYCELDHG